MSADSKKPPAKQLLLGLLAGIIFGFLLQKGGVGKYHILMGQLLLEDWTVLKTMGSAVVVGMLGIYLLNAAGKVELHIKETRLGGNIIGGLIFGIGFALSAYCPGTNLAALGQGNWDALAVIGGLLVGSFLYAESSGFLDRTLKKWGTQGKQTLPDLLPIPRGFTVAGALILIVIALIALEIYT